MRDRHKIEEMVWDKIYSDSDFGNVQVEVYESYFSKSDNISKTSNRAIGRWILDFLGKSVTGRTLLDFGCGTGRTTVAFALGGAFVHAFDISGNAVDTAYILAERHGVKNRVRFVRANAEELPYRDESFDLIFGQSILHHVSLDAARSEVYRVLKKGGRAAFIEPLGHNPILTFAREFLPYPGKTQHGTDVPLKCNDIHFLAEPFGYAVVEELELTEMLMVLLSKLSLRETIRSLLVNLDRNLLKSPSFRKYCRLVLIGLEK